MKNTQNLEDNALSLSFVSSTMQILIQKILFVSKNTKQTDIRETEP